MAQSSVFALTLAAPLPLSGTPLPPESPLDALKGIFLTPPPNARPLTRWWWFGGAVTPEEITRELTLMRDAGLGGVELNPVYPVEVDDPQRGIRNTRYFSPEWFDLLRHTVKETRRLGLQFDFTLGSGWPYGGPFVPIEWAARKLQVITKDIMGPADLTWDLGMEFPAAARPLPAVAAPILPSQQVDLERAVIIEKNPPQGWKVPAGAWRIMVFADSPTLMQVKRPTVGLEGYVLDHFRRESLDLFLKAAGDRTLDGLGKLDPPPFRSIFCDSLEVQGADWTADFLQEFRARRGYDLTPYLPALWQDAGPRTPAIRYDYHLTLSDLILDNFFRPLAEWGAKRGMTARLQAHGAMGDVMRAYGLADVPEGEHYGPANGAGVDISHRRLASSAAHIYQKPVVSAESFTWLKAPMFTVSLELMKAATDAQFLDGVNQIVNHGYPYSPPQAGPPGWIFYAPTVVNHNNLWWRHYPLLARYTQRCAALLQQGVAVNRVAVYLPLADVYSKFGAGSLQMNDALEAHMGAELVTALRRAGYDFDFINDDALQRLARVENGRLVAGTGVFSVVMVPPTRYMPPESLSRLAEFVESGGLLQFVSRAPDEAPGLVDRAVRTRRLRETLNEIWGDQTSRENEIVAYGNGKVQVAQGISEVIAALRRLLPPDFEIVEAAGKSDAARQQAAESIGFVRRGKDGVDFYFLSNTSASPQDIRARFAVGHRTPQLWNPESGFVDETPVYRFEESSHTRERVTEVQLRLEALESCFVVFGSASEPPCIARTNWPGPLRIERTGKRIQIEGLAPQNGEYFAEDAKGRRHRFIVEGVPAILSVTGPWRLTFEDGKTLSLPDLKSWTEIPERKNYSGWVTYEADIEVKDTGEHIEWRLDLGEVRETAEAMLNGVSLGAAWKGLRRLNCSTALHAGLNQLRVEVANLWINKAGSLLPRDLTALSQTYGVRWSSSATTLPPMVLPSGLIGPVRLLPFKRWTARF